MSYSPAATKEDIISFEQEIADLFKDGKIRAPVHLRRGREDQLLEIFQKEEITKEDYLFAFWDAHDLSLLKGVPREELREAIMQGKSISLCFPEHRILCSGIVGSLMGTAVGLAWSLKKQGKKERVFLFCGDMSAETGIFHEAVKYAYNYDLPVHFIVSDNGLSVMTDTREVWGVKEPWFENTKYAEKITYFTYKNDFPHSGVGWKIKF